MGQAVISSKGRASYGGSVKLSIIKELEAAAKTYKARLKPWTADEEHIIRTFYRKVPMNLLCEKLGRGIGAVQQKARKLVVVST